MPDQRLSIGALIRAALKLDKEETEQAFPKDKADAIFARIQKDLSSSAGEGSVLSSTDADFEHPSIEEEPEDFFDLSSPKISAAEALPEGWNWYQYVDGSGSLRSPEEAHYFAYDLQPYHNQGGIEYKESNQESWGPFWGTMSEFKKYAEETVQKKYLQEKGSISLSKQEVDQSKHRNSSASIGEHNVAKTMDLLAENAWYGRQPLTATLYAGEHVIEMQGYTYEPSYEDFSATSSISLDGQTLYGKDSRNVGPYRNETYMTGIFDTLEAAVAHIQEKTQGLDIVSSKAQAIPLDEKLINAQARCEAVDSDIPQRTSERSL